jgi:uncharacterized protein
MDNAQEKLEVLKARLRAIADDQKILIAYSGGVDSAFLLAVAHEVLGENAQPVIGISPSLLPEEWDEAREVANRIGANLREIETHEIDDENYNSNPNNRCYFCKSELFSVLQKFAREENFAAICDGTNLDDMTEWRPGAQAGAELGVLSPLRECEFSKAEIREFSQLYNLPTWDKPAMPCLSSRIPYGTPVTREALQMIGRAEVFFREKGVKELRVRHYVENEKPIARLEIAPHEISKIFAFYEEAAQHLKSLGYSKVLLDLEGYRRGKMNDALAGSTPAPIAFMDFARR